MAIWSKLRKRQRQESSGESNVGYGLTFKGQFVLAAIKAGICPETENGNFDLTKAAMLWDELYKDFAGPFNEAADVFKEQRHSTTNEQVADGQNMTK